MEFVGTKAIKKYFDHYKYLQKIIDEDHFYQINKSLFTEMH